MIVLKMMASSTGDGSRKIGSVKEFVDSRASSSFFRAERGRMVEAEAKAKAASKGKRREGGPGGWE